MRNSDVVNHVKGESLFIDDFTVPEGTLYASVFTSPVAHGKIINVDLKEAENFPGVVKVITSKDIPGINQVGGIIQDESLLAEDEVHFIGEPIVLIIAVSELIAKQARSKIIAEFDELEVIVEPREAYEKDLLIMPPKTFENGDINKAFSNCDLVVEGTVESGGQEHLYLETQGAITIPKEDEQLRVISSTQSPTAVQKVIARVLQLSMNKIEVDVLRLGGAFGGKEDQATHWAVLTALGAHITKKTNKACFIQNR